MTLDPAEAPDLLRLLRGMQLIRLFEERLQRRSRPGFQLYSSGEEAVAVGVCAALGADDQLLSSGRSLGPALARGVPPAALLAEVLGKATGPCRGKAGRGHVALPAVGFFGAHAVVGGNLSVAAGVALALQQRRVPGLAVCLFGDGACGAGALHETLNLAALWRLPLLFVCANNQYAVSTPIQQALAAQPLAQLAWPFGIPACTVDGMDVLQVREHARALAQGARNGQGPGFLECLTYRFTPHSTASRESRPADEIAAWQQRCPIRTLTERLRTAGLLTEAAWDALQTELGVALTEAEQAADAAPEPDLAEGLCDVG